MLNLTELNFDRQATLALRAKAIPTKCSFSEPACAKATADRREAILQRLLL